MDHHLCKRRVLWERWRTVARGAVGISTVGALFAVAALTGCAAAIPDDDHLEGRADGEKKKNRCSGTKLYYKGI
jgi:hypothetical protein